MPSAISASGSQGAILRRAFIDALVKLDPRKLTGNPVILATEVVAVLATISVVDAFVRHASPLFAIQIALWLWATVLFANLAESVAEGRGKAAADSLRAARVTTNAKLINEANGQVTMTPSHKLGKGDLLLVEAGDVIPADGDIVEGVASVNESAITGESAPVIRESGGDRSAVTGGTTVVSDWIKVRVTAGAGDSFLDRMIAMVEGANRRKTPNEIALAVLLAGLTLVFLVAVVTLLGLGKYSGVALDPMVLGALFVCLIPTTIGGLLSAVGIAGMDRLLKVNVLATSGRAVEAAGDVDTLLLDKTGTITFGNRMATEVIAAPGVAEDRALRAALMASLADETPEGRSILELAREKHGLSLETPDGATAVAFSATTRMSGLDVAGTSWRKGAVDAVYKAAGLEPKDVPAEVAAAVDRIARSGGTPLAVSENGKLMGVIHLKDVVKPGVKERFADLRRMGLRTVMITGDNPVTAATIASEAGVDDFLAEATPEDKLRLIREEQAKGRLVAMCGDGSNDAPALAQADVGVAMQTGTQAAREAGNMVDLDSDPTKLIEIVEVGKQMLITRGALTTFSIANDVAKYFAIIPAMFVVALPSLAAINIMHLSNPHSAILSAVIFNALVIIALIPLALRGVRYQAIGAARLLSRNLMIYGLGGVIAPFIGIKIIDVLIHAINLA
ncbi:MAG: potassium-transporting ATPase subunit KdpB [Caulobacteraceae bacterium]|nr:potassium-transporting ATPase subunit KdpB [Caulobacteraceae bacterium]